MTNKINWYALRWIVLRRDNFTCQYCGQHAPDVILHVDHKNPTVNGGTCDESNLITTCSACNIGKNMKPLIITEDTNMIQVRVQPLRKVAHPTRKDKIIEYLRTHGACTAFDISEETKIHRSNVSRILTAEPEFSVAKKSGKKLYYDLT